MVQPSAPMLSSTSAMLRQPTSDVLTTGFDVVHRNASWGRLLPYFVAMPFTVFAVESSLASQSGRHEAIASTLGAGRTRTFVRITLPALAPALVAGAVLAFARSVGEFGATLTFAGSLAGVTRTAPLEIYLARETDPQTAVALGLVLVVVAIVVVAAAFRPFASRA